MIAITGSTGQLGQLAIKHLREKVSGNEIVALARSVEKANEVLGSDIVARQADYEDPASLKNALQGVKKLLLISSNEVGKRFPQHRNVIDAAKAAGVELLVYTSLLRADTSPLNLAPEHLETEKYLKSSGLPYIILRNGWYSENYTASVPGALQAGAFIGSAGDGKISSAAREDYAEAAVAALTGQATKGKTYELAGDSAYTLTELASILSEVTGKTIPYQNLPEDEYANILIGAGLPEGLAKGLASWDISASQGALFGKEKALSQLIGRSTTPIRESIQAAIRL